MKLILTIAFASTQATIHRGKNYQIHFHLYAMNSYKLFCEENFLKIFLKHQDKLKTMMVTSRQQLLPEDPCSICQDTNKDSLSQICQTNHSIAMDFVFSKCNDFCKFL